MEVGQDVIDGRSVDGVRLKELEERDNASAIIFDKSELMLELVEVV